MSLKTFFTRFWKRPYTIALIVLVSLALHVWAAWQLPLDADEPVYMQAGKDYAQFIKAGDLQGIIDYPENREHPAFVKLVYALPYLLIDNKTYGSYPELDFNRAISVIFGTGTTWLIAVLNPLAGALYAFHTMSVKYTSEVYLEAIPLFASLAAVLAFLKSTEGKKRWLWAAAVLLGLAGAGKFTYLLAAVPILYLALTRRPIEWRRLTLAAAVSVAAFVFFNPSLWNQPIQRMSEIFSFHSSYTQSMDVLRANYPWYQPIVWLSDSVPWHPEVFFYVSSDLVIFLLCLIGLYPARKKYGWAVLWVIAGVALLLVWPTKWPQYTIMLVPAMSLVAAELLRQGYVWLRDQTAYWEWVVELFPRPGKKVILFTIVFVSVLTGGKVIYEIKLAIARQGWLTVTAETTPLPSNSVMAITRANDGRMVLGTKAGVEYWTTNLNSPWGDEQSIIRYTKQNSGLGSSAIFAVVQSQSGDWWFGTDEGISRFDGQKWTHFSASDLGLKSGYIHALVEDPDGKIWAGTAAGASVWDGKSWKVYAEDPQGLQDDNVQTIAFQTTSTGTVVWFGTLKGVSRLELGSESWTSYDFSVYNLNWSGVKEILVDQKGIVWAGTLSGGLGRFDGSDWTFQRRDNSSIPANSVTQMIETSPGVFFVGFNYATEPGGTLGRYDGTTWQEYTPTNSGFGGAEIAAFALDSEGRLWIGTIIGGLQIYQFDK